MRKFLQWSLVTVVAVALMAVVVGQMLATTTGRARDASVAVLKEKLARLEAERVAEPVAAPDVVEVTPDAGNDLSHAPMDEDELRARWIALFEKTRELSETCAISHEILMVAAKHSLDPKSPSLDDEVLDALIEYQKCIEPTLAELQALRDSTPDIRTLFKGIAGIERLNISDGVSWLKFEAHNGFFIEAGLGDALGVADTFTSLSYLAVFASSSVSYYDWTVGETKWWLRLKPAIENGTVEIQRWNRLREILEIGRSQTHFLEGVRRATAGIVESFETWEAKPLPYKFSDFPVTYVRSWAYPRLTPALFNHDFDRFNRAMDKLLDLAAHPYYEVKDDLERFCEEFDVEQDIESRKFTRGNPGWEYVLGLSRHEFEQNARNQASIDMIQFAILLEKHKRDNGSYPDSLEVFTEAMGGSLPVYPLMGDAYVYERTGDSFRLGFREETVAELVALGVDPVTVTWWHDPLGYEDFDEHPAAENVTATENSQ